MPVYHSTISNIVKAIYIDVKNCQPLEQKQIHLPVRRTLIDYSVGGGDSLAGGSAVGGGCAAGAVPAL